MPTLFSGMSITFASWTSNSSVLIRNVPGEMTAICGPRSPPPAMNAFPSWNESQSTCRAMMWPLGSGLPSRASTTPIWPGGTLTASATLTENSSGLIR
jgi:hypothetical protein